MEVRQLIGPYAGQIQEMPLEVAMNCIASGTACKPGEEHTVGIKGNIRMIDPDPASEQQQVAADSPTEEAQGSPETAAADPGPKVAEEPEEPAPAPAAKPAARKAARKKK